MQRHDLERRLTGAARAASMILAGALAVVGGCNGRIGPSSLDSRGGTGNSAGPGAGLAGKGGSSSMTAGGAGTGSTVPTGAAGSGGTGGPVVFAPAPGAVRRLTRAAYLNSLRDLLGGAVTVGDLEPDSSSVGGFASVTAATGAISSSGVQDYQSAADAATTQVFADTARRDKLLGCKPQSTADTACFQSFVKTFGRLAWRQPLTSAQVTRYTQLISSLATTGGDAYEAMRLGMSTLLQSPNFLYRVEQGAAASGSKFWQYTSSEIASRLSYFLTNSTPDTTLLDLADSDGLRTVDAVAQQANRLLGTTAGRESVGNFAAELFQLPTLANRAKDPTLFPQYTPALQSAMMQEIPAMFQALAFDQPGASAMDLFTTRNTFVTKELASLYGLPTTGLTSTALAPVTLPAVGGRAGILGTAGFLALNAGQTETSPTLRGKFIREVMMCQAIPPPPPNVNTILPDPPMGVTLTKRQRMTMHEQSGACAGCHQQMDPLGFPLENFDAIGRYRTTDNGLPVDASGQIDTTTFNGIAELGQVLANRPEVSDCLVQHFYRYGTGHVDTDSEQPVLDALKAQFRSGGYRVRDLLVAIVTSDGFRYVAPAQ
jgi:hypothetical protein